MSHESITQATQDKALNDRVGAAISKEAWANEQLGNTPTGQGVKTQGPGGWLSYFMWPIAIDYEAQYEYALNTDPPNSNPGGDVGVISDANISAAIQAHWPDSTPSP